MKVSISDLQELSQRLLLHIEQSGHEFVEIPVDYYWDVSEDSRYNPLKEPKNLNLGQIEDDWSELQKIIQGKNEPIGYALVWLAAILRAIGEEVVS